MTCFVGRVFGLKPIQSPLTVDPKSLAYCEATEADDDESCSSETFDESSNHEYELHAQQDNPSTEDEHDLERLTSKVWDSNCTDPLSPIPLDGRQRINEMIDFSSLHYGDSKQSFMMRDGEDLRQLETCENGEGESACDQAISISDSDSISPVSPKYVYGDKIPPFLPSLSTENTIDEHSEYKQGYNSPSLALHVPDFVSPLGVTSDDIGYQRDHLQNLGEQMEKAGKLSEALQFYEMCQELDETLQVSLDDSAAVQLKIGIVYWKMSSYQESIKSLNWVLSLYEDTLGPSWLEHMSAALNEVDCMVLAETFLTLGRVNLSLGDTYEARIELKHGLSVLGASHLDHEVVDPVLARGLHCVGMTYEAEGRESKALKYCHEALALQKELYGNCHVDVAATLASIGSLRENLGDTSEAMKCFVDALSLYESLLEEGASKADVGVMLSKIGWVCFREGHYESAMEAYEEAIEIFKEFLGERHRNVASVLVQIGMVHDLCNRHEEALCSYKKALIIQRQALGDFHNDIAITLSAIAASYETLGRFAKAISYYDKVLYVRRTMRGKRNVDVGETFSYLGNLYTRTKQYHLARQCYSNALKILTRNRIPAGDDRLRLISESLQHLSRVQHCD